MGSFPKLSYVCPIAWSEMRGDEKERFCSKCSRTVVNISLLTEAQRAALLRTVPADQLCVAYYRRLSGEFVSAENPLKPAELRNRLQYGAAALSLAAMAAAAGSALAPKETLDNASREITRAGQYVKFEAEQIIEKVAAPFFPRKKAPPVTMIMGMVCAPPPPSSFAPPPAPPSTPDGKTSE